MIFRARQFEFRFPRPTLLMGVVNVTPDSFSDGGEHFSADAAVVHALKLVEEGTDFIDIGGESTRPGATPVSECEELRRVLPVIQQVVSRIRIPISIDTQKPAVARAALEAGASIVNDIGAGRAEDTLWRVVAEHGAGYVAMHMQGTPPTMQADPCYRDVVAEMGDFFSDRLSRLQATGVTAEQVILDVGIGFGKTAEHNLLLLAGLESFIKWNRPLLLGVSRKSFISQVGGGQLPDRLPGSLACACWGVQAGVQIIRTHDVAQTRRAIRMIEAIQAREK